MDVARIGPPHEWHLLLPNSFEELTLGLVPWFHESVIGLGPALPPSWLKAIRAFRHSVAGDRLQQLLVEHGAELQVVFTQQSQRRLERFERLHRPLEAD